jgi:hypothetical protein
MRACEIAEPAKGQGIFMTRSARFRFPQRHRAKRISGMGRIAFGVYLAL